MVDGLPNGAQGVMLEQLAWTFSAQAKDWGTAWVMPLWDHQCQPSVVWGHQDNLFVDKVITGDIKLEEGQEHSVEDWIGPE